jgi:multisubunit Na+/H+ antiporter MnhB subunit
MNATATGLAQPPRKTWRSIGAIFAGALVAIVLSLSTDSLLVAAGVFPPLGQRFSDNLLLIATAHRTIYGVLGAYFAARLAPRRPMKHALILGVIGLAISILGTIATWNKGPAFGPHWYPLALDLLAMPQSWLGGKLRELQITRE